MKPDKIYLNIPKGQTDVDVATWDTKEFDDCENVCYIRKDYLLEWAKGMFEIFHKKYRESNERAGGHWWQMVTFETLIDKLNEK